MNPQPFQQNYTGFIGQSTFPSQGFIPNQQLNTFVPQSTPPTTFQQTSRFGSSLPPSNLSSYPVKAERKFRKIVDDVSSEDESSEDESSQDSSDEESSDEERSTEEDEEGSEDDDEEGSQLASQFSQKITPVIPTSNISVFTNKGNVLPGQTSISNNPQLNFGTSGGQNLGTTFQQTSMLPKSNPLFSLPQQTFSSPQLNLISQPTVMNKGFTPSGQNLFTPGGQFGRNTMLSGQSLPTFQPSTSNVQQSLPTFQPSTSNVQQSLPTFQPSTSNVQQSLPTFQPSTSNVQQSLPTFQQTITPSSIDFEIILSKIPGITINGITPSPQPVTTDINDILVREDSESEENFEIRRRITMKLVSIPDYKLSNNTAVVAGLIMMKKARLGVPYDPEVEAAINYLKALLER